MASTITYFTESVSEKIPYKFKCFKCGKENADSIELSSTAGRNLKNVSSYSYASSSLKQDLIKEAKEHLQEMKREFVKLPGVQGGTVWQGQLRYNGNGGFIAMNYTCQYCKKKQPWMEGMGKNPFKSALIAFSIIGLICAIPFAGFSDIQGAVILFFAFFIIGIIVAFIAKGRYKKMKILCENLSEEYLPKFII